MKIVISGTPGTGKSTVAKLLSEKLGYKVVEIADIVKREKLYTRYDKKLRAYVLDLSKAKQFFSAFLSKENNLLIVGHDACELVPPSEIDWVIVLRCDPDELRVRLKRKNMVEEKLRENIEAEILDVCLISALKNFDRSRIHEINTTNKTPEDIVGEIESFISGKKPGKIGIANWLEKIARENRLSEFFER